eukprot:scaffold117784_cov42-Phaeocystis_antarctica.AAC.1
MLVACCLLPASSLLPANQPRRLCGPSRPARPCPPVTSLNSPPRKSLRARSSAQTRSRTTPGSRQRRQRHSLQCSAREHQGLYRTDR